MRTKHVLYSIHKPSKSKIKIKKNYPLKTNKLMCIKNNNGKLSFNFILIFVNN